jgi:hypothetical protein
MKASRKGKAFPHCAAAKPLHAVLDFLKSADFYDI